MQYDTGSHCVFYHRYPSPGRALHGNAREEHGIGDGHVHPLHTGIPCLVVGLELRGDATLDGELLTEFESALFQLCVGNIIDDNANPDTSTSTSTSASTNTISSTSTAWRSL